MKKKVLLYSPFERFWHWSQTLLVIFLIVTGFEIHSSFSLFGYDRAVAWHNLAAWAFIILIVFAIFWHIVTGEWKQYMPTRTNLKAQVEYYVLGIFFQVPHPTHKTQLSKLNPLQRVVYLSLKVLIIPIMVISGLLYMYFRNPNNPIELGGIRSVALIHTFGAFVLLAFLIVHLYLITTGQTLSSNLKAMLTGYEEIKVDQPEAEAVKEPANA
jgi:thiosulfate reductase cytochrome b subunit